MKKADIEEWRKRAYHARLFVIRKKSGRSFLVEDELESYPSGLLDCTNLNGLEKWLGEEKREEGEQTK